MTKLLRDNEPRIFNPTELFSWNNFYEKWGGKNKIFFVETQCQHEPNTRSFDGGEPLEA